MNKYQLALDKVIRELAVDLGYSSNTGWIERKIEDLKEVKSELERLEEENAKLKEEYLQMKKIIDILRDEGVDVDTVEDCISD